ncbi:MAG: hypothetical protein JSR36_18760 [Proteobacteria bacterium]|nr:hypothetical protein [Pseudomonadota bacterium]
MFRSLLTCTVACLLAAACTHTPAPTDAAAASHRPIECAGPATASRIPNSGCGPGQAYSQDDIRSTGKPTAAGALTLLDPTLH